MQTGCMLINWEEALMRSKAGTLLDDVLEATNADGWVIRPSETQWPSDSTMQYEAVAEFIRNVTGTLTEAQRVSIQMSIGKFMIDAPPIDDLSGALGDEGLIATISPIHASEMTRAMACIDRAELKRVFEERSEGGWTNILKSFDNHVWQYLEQWRGMLDIAAKTNMGLHAYMG